MNQPPPNLQILFDQAVGFHQQGRLADAARLYEQLLAVRPQAAGALHLLGIIRAQQGQNDTALELIGAALKVNPRAAGVLADYGNVLRALGRFKEALASYDKALAIQPNFAEALSNRAIALADLKRFEDALANYDRALAVKPDFAEALNGRGSALYALGRMEEALASYDRALAIRPGFADTLNNRSIVLSSMGRFEEALAGCDRTLAIQPDFADALNNRGLALWKLNRLEEALASYERALAIDPNHPKLFGNAAYVALDLCDWPRAAKFAAGMTAQVAARGYVSPLVLLGYSADASLQLAGARHFVEDQLPVLPQPMCKGAHTRRDRIRVAYLSSDFGRHPVSYQIAELFERHDRSRFEIVGISLGRDDGSEMRARLVKSFDQFHDVQARIDGKAAELLHSLEVDIAVDLNGHTGGARPGILAHRPAPVQVSYLGYPGTMGAGFIDYIIADRIVLPFDRQPFFTEQIVHLPDTFWVSDSGRRIGEATTRRAAGLPETGFVFCCFNRSWKLTTRMFDIWMRLLDAVPGSVLWLKPGGGTGVDATLRREAASRGIDPQRLVFAANVEIDEHLARYRLADLFLDTLPYNAHATASDALWAGLPVLTCKGEAFAGRVGASLLDAIGLPELIADGLREYEALALQLARDPPRLKALREKLARNRLAFPLFDTDRLRRNIESAYTTMRDISRRGEPTRSFGVES